MKARAILLIAACIPMRAEAAPWYEEATYSCQDPAALRPILTAGPWFTRKLPLEFINPAQGRVYAKILDREFAGIGTMGREYETLDLTAQQAATLRSIISGTADQYETSVLSAIGQDFISDFALDKLGATFTGNLAFTGLKAFLDGLAGAHVSRLRSIAPLIAGGGRLSHTVKLVSKSGRAALATAYVYDVAVGNEQRRVILSACLYPANVLTNHFITETGLNDLELRKDGAIWRIYRKGHAAEQLPGRHLIETAVDGEWVYATMHHPGVYWHGDRHRISRTGGAWETYSSTESRWVNVYTKVVPSAAP